MKRFFPIVIFCGLSAAFLNAQPVVLTFTGRIANGQYVPLDRVVVSNLTKGWQEALTWPDTVLVMTPTGIEDVETVYTTSLRLSQNSPNPFEGTTFVNLQVSDPGDVMLEITDIAGRAVVGANISSPMQAGIYAIRIALSSTGLYFLTARQNGQTASVKMLNWGDGGCNAIVVSDNAGSRFIASDSQKNKNGQRDATDNPFDLGDQMKYVGFATINGIEQESGYVMQVPQVSQTIALSFAQPCPGTPTMTDIDGNIYNTLLLGNQCWMKENLRTTSYADGDSIPFGTYSSGTEPFYYDDSGSSIPLAERGYFYNWLAVMHGAASSGAVPSGVQGVCPDGWHLPSDAEWTILTNYVSSQLEYTCGGNASYIAKSMAYTSWWESYNGECSPCDQSENPNNASGFGAVPVGSYWSYGYEDIGHYASFWSSTETDYYSEFAYYLGFDYDSPEVLGGGSTKSRRFSVRCLRDE